MLKFTCEKTPLFSAVAVASRTVAQKSPISVLEGIHLRAEQDTLSLTGYDLENGITISLPAQVREAGECVLPPRLFFDIVRKMRCALSNLLLLCEMIMQFLRN